MATNPVVVAAGAVLLVLIPLGLARDPAPVCLDRPSTFPQAGVAGWSGEQLENAATIIRTADAAGCGGVILIGDCCDPYSVEGVRACQVLARFAQGKEMMFQLAVVPLLTESRVTGFAGSVRLLLPRRSVRPALLPLSQMKVSLPGPGVSAQAA